MHGLCMKMEVLICWRHRVSSWLDPNCASSKRSPCSRFAVSCRGYCVMMLQKPPTEATPTPPISWAEDGPPTFCTCSQPSHMPSVLTKSLQWKPSPGESFQNLGRWWCWIQLSYGFTRDAANLSSWTGQPPVYILWPSPNAECFI